MHINITAGFLCIRLALFSLDRTRQNHAIEHGTVSILIEGGQSPTLGGLATPFGFFIFGTLSLDQIVLASRKSLDQLQSGNSQVAVSPYCGTNLLVGAFTGAFLARIIFSRTKNVFRSLAAVTNVILFTSVLKNPLGNVIQRKFTTLADVQDIKIQKVRQIANRVFWIQTERIRD